MLDVPMAPEPGDGGWIALARVEKTQGRKGELAAKVLSDVPGRWAQLQSAAATAELGGTGVELRLVHPDGRWLTVHLRHWWPHKGRVVLGFSELEDLSAAEAWVGARLEVPAAARAAAPAGAYYVDDLLGCTVFDGDHAVGRIAAIEPVAGAAPLLHVATAAGECLIPFVEAYQPVVSLPDHRVTLRLPPGLLDVNDAGAEAGATPPLS